MAGKNMIKKLSKRKETAYRAIHPHEADMRFEEEPIQYFSHRKTQNKNKQ